MPLSIDPEARTEVWLASDEAKPPESRPVFIAKFGSVRDRRRVLQLRDDVLTAEDKLTPMKEELSRLFTGWRNMGDYDFARDGWEGPLTAQEMYDLLGRWLEQTQLAETDRLGFTSQVASVGASSATDAPADAA